MNGHKVSTVITDNGKEFEGLVSDYLTKEGIIHLKSSPYYPQQNGAAERTVRTIKKKMMMMLENLRLNQDEPTVLGIAAKIAAHSHNITSSEKTHSPFKLMFGRDPDMFMVPFVPVHYKINGVLHLGLFLSRSGNSLILHNKRTKEINITPRQNTHFLIRTMNLLSDYATKFRTSGRWDPLYALNHIENLFEVFPVIGNTLVETGLNPMMHDEEQERVKEAILSELTQFKTLKVLGTKTERTPETLTSRFVLARKGNGYKARLVIRGFQERDDGIDGTVALPNTPVRALAIIFALATQQHLILADIRTAFLHVPAARDLTIQLPKNLPANDLGFQAGCCYHLKKHAYGLKDASKRFVEYFETLLKEQGFKLTYPGCFKRKNELICAYVDDLIIISKDTKRICNEISKLTTIKEFKVLEEGNPLDFLGCTLQKTREGILRKVKVKDDGKENESTYRWTKEKIASHLERLANSRHLQRDECSIKENQRVAGKLTWKAMQQFHWAYPASLAATLTKYTDEVTRDLIRFLHNLKLPNESSYAPIDFNHTKLTIFCDAAHQRNIRAAHWGYVFFLGDKHTRPPRNPIAWASRKDGRLTRSSTASEFIAVLEALIQCQYIVPMVRTLFGAVDITLKTDSKILMQQLNNPFNSCEMKFELAMAKQIVLDYNIQIEHCSTNENIADMLTKLQPDIFHE